MGPQVRAGALALALCALPAVDRAAGPENRSADAPVFQVTVIERTMKSINYRYRSGPTSIDFRGTVLLSAAKGEAQVESKRGRTEIEAKFSNLTPPTRFGREYLTYVFWAITPEGRPHNLGEIVPDGANKARLRVTTDLQAFGLMVTAEPYFAVRQPGDVVVLENQVRADTMGKIDTIRARYELLPRGHYTWRVPNDLRSDVSAAPKVSMNEYEALLALYEAENAVGIARARGAEQYAPNTFGKADELLEEARRMQASKGDMRTVVETAREAAQMAEDARLVAQGRQQSDKLAQAKSEAIAAQQARQQAEAEAEDARIRAEAAKAEAETARAQAREERAARLRVEAEVSAVREQAAAEAARRERDALLQREAQNEAARKTALRAKLLQQLAAVTETRDTPRGLVVTVPEADFRGPMPRQPVADRLAVVGAIVAAQPGLTVTVEGHTDSGDGEALSGSRARAVRDILMRRGLSPDVVSARAFGDTRPLVSNATASGRRENRRVEIVIFGDPIGNLPFWDHTYTLSLKR